MTGLDWLIAGATLLFAVSGYLRGFIVGALSLAGFVAGAIVGTRIADALLPAGRSSPYAPIFGLFGALTAGVILATGIGGLGMRLRRGAARARPRAARRRARRAPERGGGARHRVGARASWRSRSRAAHRCAAPWSAPRSCAAWTS